MRARSFSHVGITVSDFNRAVQFYWEIFGCPLVGVADTPPDRVRASSACDAPQPSCKIGWIRVPGGGVLEIFEFQPQLPARCRFPGIASGLTHFSFNVRNLQKWYDYLVEQGRRVREPPERSPRGHSFFFVKDFDGNLIELMDLGYMYHVLGWLGPLGGWLFRRGMYKRYYQGTAGTSPLLDERAVPEFGVRPLQFLLGVHHDRAVPGHRLLDRLSRRRAGTGCPRLPAWTTTSSPLSKRTSERLPTSRRVAVRRCRPPRSATARGAEASRNVPDPSKT